MYEAELSLEGKYTDNDLTNVQQLFIRHIQRVTPMDKVDERITYK